jgi:GNAT superfamily N-acetyltransferase
MSNADGDAPGAKDISEQVRGLTRRTLTALAERVEVFEHGFAARTRSLPQVWTLNQVRIVGPSTAGEVVALADRFQDGLHFRHVVIEGERGATLVDELVAAGWQSEREVVMAMTRPVVRGIDTSQVVELSEAQMLALMREWLLEERDAMSTDALDQVTEYNRLEGALFDETRLGVVAAETPLAVTKLRSSDGIAWVEDVYTTSSARGQGLARALLAEAVGRAWDLRPGFVYIIADDNDWPKNFYGRAGFVPVGLTYTFHRDVA